MKVDEYKYLELWLNRQGRGHNQVKHLSEKASSMHGLACNAKFWRGAEDIQAGLVMWEAACNPRLKYDSEVWA